LWARGMQRQVSLTRWLESLLDFLATGRRPLRVVRTKKKETRKSRIKTDDQFNAERKEDADRLDRILDKISRHGYDRLTAEEKEFLFRQSNQ